jgi:hypothetical protein
VGKDGAAAPAGLELQLGKGLWTAAHGPTACAGGAKGGDGSRGGRREAVADAVAVDSARGGEEQLVLWTAQIRPPDAHRTGDGARLKSTGSQPEEEADEEDTEERTTVSR